MFTERMFYRLGYFLVPVGTLSLLIGLHVLAAQPARAQGRSAALEKVIEEAKKEGLLKLQWIGGRLDGEAGLRPMVAAINKMYGTNIKLQYTPGPNFPMMLNKITQEKNSELPSSTDINLMTANHVAQRMQSGMLKKMDWRSILERPAPPDANVNRVTPEGAAVIIGSRVVGITYNSDLVKGDDVPVSMEDILKPKWKGKIASNPLATGFYQFAAKDILGYEYMKSYIQRLAKQIGGLIPCPAVDRIASGEFAMLVLDCGQDDALRYQKRGAPLGHTTFKEATRIDFLHMGIPVHAEHPNAAALFINFLHTQEGQALQWEHGRHDFHLYPEAQTRKLVQRVVDARGKVFPDTVERELAIGHEEVNRIRDEFMKMFKEGGR